MRKSSGLSWNGASLMASTGKLLTTLFDEFCDKTGPTRLMACPEPGAIVTVKIFIKKDEIAPVRIALENPCVTVHGTTAI